jgi:uncharacterized transporter YbjL
METLLAGNEALDVDAKVQVAVKTTAKEFWIGLMIFVFCLSCRFGSSFRSSATR